MFDLGGRFLGERDRDCRMEGIGNQQFEGRLGGENGWTSCAGISDP
jgi:hypothetical protein